MDLLHLFLRKSLKLWPEYVNSFANSSNTRTEPLHIQAPFLFLSLLLLIRSSLHVPLPRKQLLTLKHTHTQWRRLAGRLIECGCLEWLTSSYPHRLWKNGKDRKAAGTLSQMCSLWMRSLVSLPSASRPLTSSDEGFNDDFGTLWR